MKHLTKWSIGIGLSLFLLISIFVIFLFVSVGNNYDPEASIPSPQEGQEISDDGPLAPKTEFEQKYESDESEDSDATVETEEGHVHKYTATQVLPACNRKGYTVHHCECGHSYKDDYQNKTDHSYTSEIIAPTTKDKGYTLYTCVVCGAGYKDHFTDPIPEKDNSENTTTSKPNEDYIVNPNETPEHSSGSGNGIGTPETEDYGYCPYCGLRIWTSWYPTGCFTFLVDSTCDCGAFVEAGECHHH